VGYLIYLDEGKGPAVLFVHGSNSDCRIWTDHCRIIAPTHRVIAPTQRYFGSTPWPDDGRHFSIATHAADLGAFIGELKLGPIDIVGWSYGAAVCLTLAATHPEHIKRLFLYEPVLTTFVEDASSAKLAVDDRTEMTRAAKIAASEGNLDAAVQLFMDGVNDFEGTFERLPQWVQRMMLGNGRMLPLLFAAAPPQRPSCEDLGRINIPVTVALGSESRTFYRICAEWAARCMPSASRVTIPKGRHLFPIQEPGAFSELVLEFLK
jgi:pimeloyl-ACP methyl ester carboxylesterase